MTQKRRALGALVALLLSAGAAIWWMRLAHRDSAMPATTVLHTSRQTPLLVLEPSALAQTSPAQPGTASGDASPRLSAARAAGADIRPLRVNAQALLSLAEGDGFALPLPPDGPGMRGVVTQRVQHANGDVSLIGHADGDASPVVITIGKRETFIMAGGYEVSAIDGVGTAVLAARLGPPDPNAPDYVRVARPLPKPIVPRVLQ